MIQVSESVARLLQLVRSGEMSRYFPADMLEAFHHIVSDSVVLVAHGKLPTNYAWHTKLYVRTWFIVENRKRGFGFIKSRGAQGRALVLVLRNFSQSEESLLAPSQGAPVFFSVQAGHVDLDDIANLKRLLPASSDILFVQNLLALSRDYSDKFEYLFGAEEARASTACVLVPWGSWKQAVSGLIGLADCTVLFVDNPSTGLLWEVEELIRAGAEHRSILLTRGVDVSPPAEQLRPQYEDLRKPQEPDADIQGKLQGRLKDFPHRFDLQSADLGARLGAVIGGPRADRSGTPLQLDGEVSEGILSVGLRDVFPSEITEVIVKVMDEYRVRMEAASIADDPYELFTSADLVLGLSAAVSNFRVAAYASECLSLAFAHYARPEVDRLTNGSKANARTISGRLSEMSDTYLSWAGNDALDPRDFKESIRSRHDPR